MTLLIANSLKVHVSVFGDASYQWISLNSCFHCGLQVQPLLMCVTLLIAINERVRDYRARPFITTANTIINGVQEQKQQLAREQSQRWFFLYNGSRLRKYYPRNSPGKYSFFSFKPRCHCITSLLSTLPTVNWEQSLFRPKISENAWQSARYARVRAANPKPAIRALSQIAKDGRLWIC